MVYDHIVLKRYVIIILCSVHTYVRTILYYNRRGARRNRAATADGLARRPFMYLPSHNIIHRTHTHTHNMIILLLT